MLVVIFSDSKGLYAQTLSFDHWESIIYENDEWTYFPGTEEPPAEWMMPEFVEGEQWQKGKGGIGFGDDDDSTQLENIVPSLYLRKTFNIVDTADISVMVLHTDYDDAFIAYLNGKEIARTNIGIPGDRPAFDDLPVYYREAHVYKGGMPEYFLLLKSDFKDLLKNGNNTLAIQIQNDGIDSNDISGRFNLSLALNTAAMVYRPLPDWFVPPVLLETSNLPIVKINTFGNYIPDDPRIIAQMDIINHTTQTNHINDLPNEYSGKINIEMRGSSSQTRFPKKSYALETQLTDGSNNNVSLFGMPEENDWILMGPYSDKTLMRNVLTYYLSRRMGQYAARSRFCELMLNGKYEGVYLFMEKPKRDKNRIDIAKLKENDIVGDELTGGYVFKLDKKTGSGNGEGWYSEYLPPNNENRKIFFQYDYPKSDELMPEQKMYLEKYVSDFENALATEAFADTLNGYRAYIDVLSFMTFFFSNEIAYNVDGYRMSTFLHKDRQSRGGGKLKMGPVWDFNLAYGNGYDCDKQNKVGWNMDYNEKCSSSSFQIPFWWDTLFEDTAFVNQLSCTWYEYRKQFLHTDSIFQFIDEQAAYLATAQQRNFIRWPILNIKVWPNVFEGKSYEQEVALMKEWLDDRLQWLDENMPGLCNTNPPSEMPGIFALKLYPNPVWEDGLIINYNLPEHSFVNINLLNLMGQKVRPVLIQEPRLKGAYQEKIPVKNLSPGMYFLQFRALNEVTVLKFIKK